MRNEEKEKGKLFSTPLNPFNKANLNKAVILQKKKKKKKQKSNIHVIIINMGDKLSDSDIKLRVTFIHSKSPVF